MVIQSKNLYRLKAYPRGYKKRLKRINKKRERLNTNRYVSNIFDDLADYYFDNLTYGDSLRDMYGQLIDKTSEEYLFDEDPNWLEYLGRNWTLEDELDYCDKIYKKWQPEDDYNFTDEEINHAVNSWNKGSDNTELDPIQRAINAGQAVRDWQEAWRKYGIVGVVKLYFNLDNKDNNK